MHAKKQLVTPIRAMAIIIWTLVAIVDIAGDADTNPPPEPVLIGKEAWEL